MNNTSTLNFPISVSHPFILRWKFNLNLFWLLSLSFLISLIFLYIFQISSIVQNTYLLKEHHEKLGKLSEENKNLEITFSEVNSLQNLENLVQNLNYEKVNRVRYIQVLGGQVVTK